MNEFKKDLITAYEFKTVGKNKQALEIYEKCYKEHPEEFSFNQKNDYAWTIYKTRIAFLVMRMSFLKMPNSLQNLLSRETSTKAAPASTHHLYSRY